VTIISDFVHRSVASIERDKPLWNMPQAFDWSMWDKGHLDGEHRPNAAEERCLTYLALVNGAKGVIYWTFTGSRYYIVDYPEHWAAVKKIASEVRDLSPVLLTPTIARKLCVKQSGDSIQSMVKRMNGSWYVFAVNSARTPCTGSFDISGAKASDVEALFENRWIHGKSGEWTDEFKPLEVHVYRIASK